MLDDTITIRCLPGFELNFPQVQNVSYVGCTTRKQFEIIGYSTPDPAKIECVKSADYCTKKPDDFDNNKFLLDDKVGVYYVDPSGERYLLPIFDKNGDINLEIDLDSIGVFSNKSDDSPWIAERNKRSRPRYAKDVITVSVSDLSYILETRLEFKCNTEKYERTGGDGLYECRTNATIATFPDIKGVWSSKSYSQDTVALHCKDKTSFRFDDKLIGPGTIYDEHKEDFCVDDRISPFLLKGSSRLDSKKFIYHHKAEYETDKLWENDELGRNRWMVDRNSQLKYSGTLSFWYYMDNVDDFQPLFGIDSMPRDKKSVCVKNAGLPESSPASKAALSADEDGKKYELHPGFNANPFKLDGITHLTHYPPKMNSSLPHSGDAFSTKNIEPHYTNCSAISDEHFFKYSGEIYNPSYSHRRFSSISKAKSGPGKDTEKFEREHPHCMTGGPLWKHNTLSFNDFPWCIDKEEDHERFMDLDLQEVRRVVGIKILPKDLANYVKKFEIWYSDTDESIHDKKMYEDDHAEPLKYHKFTQIPGVFTINYENTPLDPHFWNWGNKRSDGKILFAERNRTGEVDSEEKLSTAMHENVDHNYQNNDKSILYKGDVITDHPWSREHVSNVVEARHIRIKVLEYVGSISMRAAVLTEKRSCVKVERPLPPAAEPAHIAHILQLQNFTNGTNMTMLPNGTNVTLNGTDYMWVQHNLTNATNGTWFMNSTNATNGTWVNMTNTTVPWWQTTTSAPHEDLPEPWVGFNVTEKLPTLADLLVTKNIHWSEFVDAFEYRFGKPWEYETPEVLWGPDSTMSHDGCERWFRSENGTIDTDCWNLLHLTPQHTRQQQ